MKTIMQECASNQRKRITQPRVVALLTLLGAALSAPAWAGGSPPQQTQSFNQGNGIVNTVISSSSGASSSGATAISTGTSSGAAAVPLIGVSSSGAAASGVKDAGGANVTQCRLQASPGVTVPGGAVQLQWSSSVAEATCSIDQGVGKVTCSGSKTVAAPTAASSSGTVSYIFSVTGTTSGGNCQSTAQVLTDSSTLACSLTADSGYVRSGESVTLTWVATKAKSGFIDSKVTDGRAVTMEYGYYTVSQASLSTGSWKITADRSRDYRLVMFDAANDADIAITDAAKGNKTTCTAHVEVTQVDKSSNSGAATGSESGGSGGDGALGGDVQ